MVHAPEAEQPRSGRIEAPSGPWSRVERIGDATLYLGDCLEVLPHIGTVDAVITDPPYAVPTIVAAARESTRNAGDLSMIETAYRAHAAAWAGVLGDHGRAFVFCDGPSYPSLYRAFYGAYTTALLVWDKGRIGMGREFRKSHELILHAWRAKTPIYTDGIGRPDVVKVPPVGKEREHPAQKPVRLIEELLTVCGKTILDPFMGSGSTGVASIRQNRKFVGVEIEPVYFDIACRRIEAAVRASEEEDRADVETAKQRMTDPDVVAWFARRSSDGSIEAAAPDGAHYSATDAERSSAHTPNPLSQPPSHQEMADFEEQA